jgi:hypothetical protein
MGIDVFRGPTHVRVQPANVEAFERIFEQTWLGDCWVLIKDAQGAITDIQQSCVPGPPFEFGDMEKLAPFVEAGSFITHESFWGDDVWRFTFHGDSVTEDTVPLEVR